MQDGTVVAVKVQHKFVKRHSFVDVYTMDFLVRTVKFFFPQFEFMWLAEEMKKNVPLELSFVQEAKNAEKVAQIMRKRVTKEILKYSAIKNNCLPFVSYSHTDI